MPTTTLPRLRRARVNSWSLAIAALAIGASGCATTRIDTAASTTTTPTSTTLPSGGATTLLPLLLDEAGRLSGVIGDDGDRSAQMERIRNVFDAVRPEIATADGLLAEDFDAAVDLCQRATQYKRPADADKCFRNLSALSDQFLATHATN